MKTSETITIKNLKHSEFTSQETHCFQATVYLNGKKLCVASNDGWGGCNLYDPIAPNTDETIKQINQELGKEIITFKAGDEEMTMESSLDIVVGDLIQEQLKIKELKKMLKKICYVKEGEVYQCSAKVKPTAANLAAIKKVSWWKAEYRLVNEMTQEEALRLL